MKILDLCKLIICLAVCSTRSAAVRKPRGTYGLTVACTSPLRSLHDKKNGAAHHRTPGQNYHESYDNQSGYVGDYSGGGGGAGGAGGGGGGGGGSGAHQALAGRGNVRRPVSGDGARFRDAAPK